MNTYDVEVTQTVSITKTITVNAENKIDAREEALEKANHTTFYNFEPPVYETGKIELINKIKNNVCNNCKVHR